MVNPQSPYYSIQKGRGLLSVLVTGFMAALASVFLWTRDPIFAIVGIFLVVGVLSGVYAFLKGETWSMSVEDGFLSWSYARWPKSSGRIDLRTVRHVVVSDWGGTLSLTFSDGSARKIKLVGDASSFRDYLIANFPHIKVEFVEGS